MSRHGRKWVKEVWQASTRTAAELDGLSPLTTPLARRLVESYGTREHADGPEIQHALRVAVVYGYTARMVLFDSTDQPSLRPSAFNLSAQSDVERLAGDDATPKRLLDPIRTIASERFDSVMTLPPEVWAAYLATTTMKLQRQFTSKNKTLRWHELGRDRVEKMLRYGYVLRCLDEAVGAEPAIRKDRPDTDPVPDFETGQVA